MVCSPWRVVDRQDGLVHKKVRLILPSWSNCLLTQLKGALVEENKPKRLSYFKHSLDYGSPPATILSTIWMCPDHDNLGPSIYKDRE